MFTSKLQSYLILDFSQASHSIVSQKSTVHNTKTFIVHLYTLFKYGGGGGGGVFQHESIVVLFFSLESTYCTAFIVYSLIYMYL